MTSECAGMCLKNARLHTCLLTHLLTGSCMCLLFYSFRVSISFMLLILTRLGKRKTELNSILCKRRSAVALRKDMRNPAPRTSQDVTFHFVAQSHCVLSIWLYRHFHIIQCSHALKSRGISTQRWQGRGATGARPHSVLVGMQTTSHFGRQLVASYKTKHALALQSGHCPPWHWSKGMDNLYPREDLHRGVWSEWIHSCPNLKATKMSFRRWMNEYTNCACGQEILFCPKKHELWSHEKIRRNLKCSF